MLLPSDSEEGFGFTRAEAATYLSPGGGNPTLALRVGGKKLWGDFPYYEAAFLEGEAPSEGSTKSASRETLPSTGASS